MYLVVALVLSQWLQQSWRGCHELCAFADWLAMTVGGTSHALVHLYGGDLWESQDLWPGIDLVDPVACGLFPKEVPVIL